jgi:hypothetical protein
MKYRLHILLLFAILLSPLFSEAVEDSRPQIYFEKINYDAGRVMEGTVIDHTFTVYNRGGETLNIRAVRPG